MIAIEAGCWINGSSLYYVLYFCICLGFYIMKTTRKKATDSLIVKRNKKINKATKKQ